MHIFRWLMKHPILLAWLLAIVAILLNFSTGTKSVEHADKVAAEHGQSASAVEQQPAPAVVAEQLSVQAAAPAVVAEQQTQAVASTPADLLRAAREAYWANELDRAVGLYNDLLKQAPDSLEYKGELANVYWKQGNAQQAATLFAEVAPKLAAQGRVTEALNMKLYVDMVNPELAKQIDATLKK